MLLALAHLAQFVLVTVNNSFHVFSLEDGGYSEIKKKKLTFRLLLHVSRIFSILLMFSSEINSSVTANSWNSGLPDLLDAVCKFSDRGSESTEALLDDCPAVFSAGGRNQIPVDTEN